MSWRYSKRNQNVIDGSQYPVAYVYAGQYGPLIAAAPKLRDAVLSLYHDEKALALLEKHYWALAQDIRIAAKEVETHES